MNNAYQAISAENENIEPFEDRIDILFRELELATKWKRPSVLFSVYSSEYVHTDAAIALENHLLDLGQRVYHLKLKNNREADISSVIADLTDFDNVIFFVEGLRWGAGEGSNDIYRALNNQREFYIENKVRIVFWLTENEAIDLAHYAPDYWAYRHRVIEFIDSPKPEQISPPALESAWQGIGELTDTNGDLDAKIALRTALLTDLPTGDESTAARANLVLTLGILHWRRGDYDRADQFLNTALDLAAKLQDNCFEGLCFNAVALIETGLGRNEEAIRAYQRAIELAPEQISAWNNLGNLHARLGHYKEALEAYQKAIEQNPSDLTSWNGLGEIYQKLGRHDDAVYAFLKTIESVPDHAQSWSGLGTAYMNEGRLEDALSAHQKALEIDRHTLNSWLGLGEIYKRQGHVENSAMAFQTAIEVDPREARAWNELGNLYYDTQAFDEAIRTYRKAVELGHASQQAYSNLASIYVHKGQYAEAIPLLQKGIELLEEASDKAQLWNRLGDAYRRLDDYDNAVSAYRKADELNSEEAAPRQDQPAAAAEMEPVAVENGPEFLAQDADPVIRSEEIPVDAPAIPAAAPVIGEDPIRAGTAAPAQTEVDFAEWLNSLGAILPAAERARETSLPEPAVDRNMDEPAAVEESPSDLAEALANPENAAAPAGGSPDEPSASRETASGTREPSALISALDELSHAAAVPADKSVERPAPETPPVITKLDDTQPTKVRHTAQADPGTRKPSGLSLSETDAKNAQIWNELGNIYYNSGSYDEAVHAFTKAIELDQTCGWTYNNLASIFVHTGRYAEAVPLYLKGIKFLNDAKDKAFLWNRVGDAYRRLGDHGSAASAYQKAVELDPDNVSLLTRARFSLLGNCRAS